MCCCVQKEEKSDDSIHKNYQDPKDNHIKQRLSYETFLKKTAALLVTNTIRYSKTVTLNRADAVFVHSVSVSSFIRNEAEELDFLGALVSDDLVCDPVEDVKDQEHQRERRPGYSVDPLRSVHKLLPVYFRVLQDRRLLDRVGRSTFDRGAVVAGKTSVL